MFGCQAERSESLGLAIAVLIHRQHVTTRDDLTLAARLAYNQPTRMHRNLTRQSSSGALSAVIVVSAAALSAKTSRRPLTGPSVNP